MSVRQDKVQLSVEVDAKQGINELGKLEAESFDLRKTLAGLKKDTDEYREANEKLSGITKQINERREALGLEGMTTRQLRNYVRELRAEQENTATAGTARYQELENKIVAATAKVEEHTRAQRGLKQSLDDIAGKVSVSVVVDGSPALNELTRLDAETAALRNHLRTLKPESAQAAEAVARIGANEQRMAQLRHEVGLTGMTLQQMRAYAKEVETQLETTAIRGTEHYETLRAELLKVNGAIQQQEKEAAGMSGFWKSISTEVKQFGAVALGALGFQWLGQQVSNLIEKNAKLADSYADIQKTTGMTKEEVQDLNAEFARMDTRTPTENLREIAISAGQLGIAKDDILGFTDATDKLVVSLGDEFEGAGEVTKVMGGLRNVFSDIKSDDVASDMLHIGNAVNVLASEGAATGPVMTDMANRIGGVGIVMGMTSGQVLGMSASLQELNIETERGSTATVKILQKMASEPEKFARVAGMPLREFKRLVDTDINAAFLAVAKGAAGSGAAATQLAHTLDQLGVDGSGAAEVMAKVGQNTDLVREKQERAAKALTDTGSILDEFSQKNYNAAGNLERLQKWLGGLFVNSKFKQSLDEASESLVRLLGLVNETDVVTRKYDQQRVAVTKLQQEILPLVNRYEQLEQNTWRTAEEQKELEKIVRTVSAAIPLATGQVDAHGRALTLNTSAAKLFGEQMDKALGSERTAAISRVSKELAGLEKQSGELRQILNSFDAETGQRKVAVRRDGFEKEDHQQEVVALKPEEVKQRMEELAGLEKRIRQLKSDLNKLNNVQTEAEILAEWEKAEKERQALAAASKGKLDKLDKDSKGLLERIDEQLKAARERMMKAQSQPGIDAAQGEIDRLEAQRKELTGEAEKERQKAAEERRKAQQQQHDEARKSLTALEKIETDARERLELERLGADQRELATIRKKYDDLKTQAAAFSTDSRLSAQERAEALVEIARLEAAEELEVEAKRDQQKAARATRSWQAYREHQGRQISLALLEAENAYKRAELKGDQGGIADAEAARTKALVAEAEHRTKLRLDDLLATKENEQARADIIREGEAEVAAILLGSADKQKLATEQRLQAFASGLQAMVQQIAAFNQQADQMELDRTSAQTNRRLADLDRQHQAELGKEDAQGQRLTAKEAAAAARKAAIDQRYQKQKEALEKQQQDRENEVKRKQMERERIMSLTQIAMTTPPAIMKAWEQGGAIYGPFLAAIVGAAALAQVGAVMAVDMPAFAEGGFTLEELNRMPRTNLSRSAGGLLPSGPFMATVNEAGPEYFVPNRLLSNPAVVNAVQVIESIRTTGRYATSSTPMPAFVEGGGTGALPPATNNSMSEQTGRAMLAALAQLNHHLANPKPAPPTRNYVLFQDIEEARDELTAIRQEASK